MAKSTTQSLKETTDIHEPRHLDQPLEQEAPACRRPSPRHQTSIPRPLPTLQRGHVHVYQMSVNPHGKQSPVLLTSFPPPP